MKWKFKKFGPWRYFTIKSTEGFSAFLKGHDNLPFGFEWGWRCPGRGVDNPIIEIRLGKLLLLFFEIFKNGFELHLLGFWIIL